MAATLSGGSPEGDGSWRPRTPIYGRLGAAQPAGGSTSGVKRVRSPPQPSQVISTRLGGEPAGRNHLIPHCLRTKRRSITRLP